SLDSSRLVSVLQVVIFELSLRSSSTVNLLILLVVKYCLPVMLWPSDPYAHTFLDHDNTHQSCRSYVNEVSPSPSLCEPVVKQLAIKLVDEFGFVIRPSLLLKHISTTSDANLDSTLSSQKGKCNSPRENNNVEDGKISKDASEIHNNVIRASHDKDNITKTFENTGLSQGDDADAKKEKQAKENCLIQFVILHTLLGDISKEDLTNTCFSSGFKRAFLSLFGEEVEYFAPRLFFHMDRLENNLLKKNLMRKLPWLSSSKIDSIKKAIVERGLYKRVRDRREKEIIMQTQEKMINMVKVKCDVGLVVNERSGTQSENHNESSRSWNDIRAEGANNETTKEFDDVKLELSNRTTKFKVYFEKLENTKVVLERQLARKIDDSKAEKDQLLKEINHLRTQLENLKGKSVETKFDKPLILGKPPADKLLINSQISKSRFTPKVVVQKDLSKPDTLQSLPKNKKDQLS
ncbi:hypothetical protein Tco_0337095, partial [Tanacetum coccineum]